MNDMQDLQFPVQTLKLLWEHMTPGQRKLKTYQPVRIYLVKPYENAEGLEFEFDGKFSSSATPSRGFDFECTYDKEADVTTVSIQRTSPDDEGMFAVLGEDLIRILDVSRSQSMGATFEQLTQRIIAWQLFMKSVTKTLPAEVEIGLYGELVTLGYCLSNGLQLRDLLTFWTGPQKDSHDFRFSQACALEVKTALNDKPFSAKISSLQQLDDADAPQLQVVAVKISPSESGHTLKDLTEAIRKKLGSKVLEFEFDTQILASGYLPGKEGRPLKKYKVDSVRAFPATEIPRYLPSTVPGIQKAKYITTIYDAEKPDLNHSEEHFASVASEFISQYNHAED